MRVPSTVQSLQPRQALLGLPILFPGEQGRWGQDPSQTLTKDLRDPTVSLGGDTCQRPSPFITSGGCGILGPFPHN